MSSSDDVEDEADLNPSHQQAPQQRQQSNPHSKSDDDDDEKKEAIPSNSPPQQQQPHTDTDAHSAGSQRSESEDNESWLTNPKRVCFIICACVVFTIMTFVILLQLYSDEYKTWKSYSAEYNRNQFIVSPTDVNRTFALITLHNGLDVLLISDRDADKAAAAIDVGIGSSSDPVQYLGLAHFHEHMLFLGSKTYSKLDSFSSYISMSGGHDNAYTENMHTNFFFQVDNHHLEHSLDIFAHFFIDPLLSKKSMSDEIWAVDNEYRKDLPSQHWRDWRMLEYSANPHDAFHQFTVGSIQSLTKHGKDAVYERMLQFHNKWVKANIMKCVIYGKQDIDTLKKWAVDKFSAVQSDQSLTKPTSNKVSTTPYRVGIETGKIYYINTIQKQKQITFVWSIAGLNLHSKYRTPVLSFIHDNLLQSATNNSLYNVLKIKLLYITSMDCDIFYDEKEWTGTSVSFELTDKGAKHVNLITYYFYKYLHLLLVTASHNKQLGDIYSLYFQQSKCMDALFFNYYSLIKKDSYSVVSGLAKRMQYREKRDLLYLSLNVAPSRLLFNLSLITQVLQHMVDPHNVIIHYTNDKFKSSLFDETEPYFHIKFHRQKIEESLMQKWSAIDPLDENDQTHTLEIPPLNPYVLDKHHKCNLNDVKLIDLNKMKQADIKMHSDSPLLITDEPSINIWYKPDDKFSSPQININLLLVSPLIYDTPSHALFSELWLQFVNFYSSEWYSAAAMASYSFELSLNHQGVVLSVSGLNDKYLSLLIRQFVNGYFANIQHHIESQFAFSLKVLKNTLVSLQKTYKNLNYDHVWSQGYFAMYDIVKIPHYDRHSMLRLVEQLLASPLDKVLHDMLNYVSDVLQSGFLIEGLFHGNIYKKSVLKLVSSIRQSGIKINHHPKHQRFRENLRKMQHLKLSINVEHETYRKFIYQGYNSNEKDTNDVVQLWYQFESNAFAEANYVDTCKVLLLARMMKSESFQVLRTEESLGYVATTFSKSSVGATNNINYLVVMVASGYKSADYLHSRVKHFVDVHYYNNVLLKLKTDRRKFKLYVNGTVNDLKQKYLRLSQETSLLWDEIIGHTYFFKWKEKFIHILNTLTLEQVIEFYKSKILGKESKWISIQLFHQDAQHKSDTDPKQKHVQSSASTKVKTHRIIANKMDSVDVLYFNGTKDLQNLGYGEYFHVY